jgi:Putative metallopeptidase
MLCSREAKLMSSFRARRDLIAALIVNAVLWHTDLFAQSQPSSTALEQASRVSIMYVPPENSAFQEVYDLLRQRSALERIQEILSPLRSPEELTIKTTECREVNSWYRRENYKPTVTICYEFLKRILESLPNEVNPDGVTPADAAVGQFFWVTLHEVGHATFDILGVPIFGHEEDAADNFATYVMLQFGEGQAHRLIAGAAWGVEGLFRGLQKESCRAIAAQRIWQRSWSPSRAFLQSHMSGIWSGSRKIC